MTQPDLIAVGYWYSEEEPDLPHPQKLAGAGYDGATRDRICGYLDSGREFESYVGYSFCRFECGVSPSAMGDRDLTDGEWVWPEGLSHYVRVHDVALPDDFVAAMERNGWCVPRDSILPRPADSSRKPVDYRFWKRWSDRPPGIAPR